VTSDERTPAASGLRVGFVPGVTLTKWRRIWAERFPRTPLEVLDVAESDQRSALDAGLVDLCFVRLPLPTDELHAIRLYDEVPVVVVPKDHPLAGHEDVALAGLASEPAIDPSLADAFDRVAWGAGVLRVPHAVARSHSRRDLTYRPIRDAEPTTIALAWLVDNPNPLIDEFVGIVRGRTANSSRTAADRAAKAGAEPQPASSPQPPKQPRRPAAPRRPARGVRRPRKH